MIAVDTNLLIYAHWSRSPEHSAARAALEKAIESQRGWGVALPSLSEFWSIVTHRNASKRSSKPREAMEFIQSLREDAGLQVWQASDDFSSLLMQSAVDLKVVGVRIFDLQIGLIAVENGAAELWTHDQNFIRVPGLKIRDPLKG